MATDKLVDFDHVTDYISREAALACFSDWIDRYGHEHSADEMAEYQRIEDLPVADVRPVKYGRWIELENQNYSPFDPTSREYDLLCSNCGAKHYGKERNFCPNCGADMRESNLDTTKRERRDESHG